MSSFDLWQALRPNADGLVAAVVQHATTGVVLMLGYMNEAALTRTRETGFVTFWSRSKGRLWKKGESSGHVLALRDLRIDCDGDAVLIQAEPVGPTCHTGAPSCFFRRVAPAATGEGALVDAGLVEGGLVDDQGPRPLPAVTLAQVFEVILDRKAGRGTTNAEGRSYVRSLLEKGLSHVGSKITEEAGELVAALTSEADDRVAAEAADLVFHALVGLAARDLHLDDVCRALEHRLGTSGIDEKNARRR